MKIQDLNAGRDPVSGRSNDGTAAMAPERAPSVHDDYVAEVAFLRARIEHLELVVETARGLMTSNQERLLRRLHELPREMAALAARVRGSGRDAAWGPS